MKIFSGRQRPDRGFTAIEVVIIIVILGVALPPLILLLYQGARNSVKVHENRVALELSKSLLEEMRSKGFSGVDDYDGRMEDPVSGYYDYTREAKVDYVKLAAPVEDSNLDEAVTPPPTTHFKRLEVKTTAQAGDSVTLVTVIASRE